MQKINTITITIVRQVKFHVSEHHVNPYTCSIFTVGQAFSQKLKVGRPRSMFLVNFLKD